MHLRFQFSCFSSVLKGKIEDTKSNVLVMFLIVENVAVSRLTREVKRNYLDNLNQLQVHNY